MIETRWLTIPEVCARLQITPEDWDTWHEQTGDMPLQLVCVDGQRRIRADHLARWIDANTIWPAEWTAADVTEWRSTRRVPTTSGPDASSGSAHDASRAAGHDTSERNGGQ